MYDYFGIQAKIGITKHAGGLKATKYLLEQCRIDSTKYVLIVCTGNGSSAKKIVKLTGCRVAGIDISDDMVKIANDVAQGVEFNVGDAEDILFPSSTFDAVLSESVTAFTNKSKSLSEYRRVLKKGGFLGLNEVTWLEKPQNEFVDFAHQVIGGLAAETADGWVKQLEKARFKEVKGISFPLRKIDQFAGEVQLQGLGMFRILGRFFYFYLTDMEYRKSVHKMGKDALKMPKDFMRNFGYGLYIGIK